MNRWWLVVVAAGVVSLALGPPVGAAAEKEAGEGFILTGPVVFPLDEVPAFGREEASGRTQYRYARGQSAGCGPVSSSAVKKYPQLKSKRPLYGAVKFGGNPLDPTSGTTFHFVLDEAGEAEKKPEASGGAEPKTPADTPKATSNAGRSKPTLLKALAQNLAATPDPLTQFRQQEIKQTYDLLYFDCNGDLDLTNDGVVRLAAKPVFEAMPAGWIRGLSGEIEVSFDFGPDLGKRPFPIAVAVYAYQGGFANVSFLPKTARRGTITFGEEQSVALLSQGTMITGRYDRPSTRLELVRVDRPATTMLLQPGSLGQVHWIGEQLVSISTTPLGDKLTIAPYRGDTGVLEIGPGGRAITELGLAGQLASRTGTTMLGSTAGGFSLPETLPRSYKLPVGDYGLPTLTARYGRLRFSARTAPALASGSASSPAKPPTFPVQIRKDARFVLEFSGKPEVVFMNPTKDKAFRPGDKVDIRAMLTEPGQGLQITGLWDITRKEKEVKYQMEGREVTVPQYARLDPSIAIKNSAGEVVVEGKMPFG